MLDAVTAVGFAAACVQIVQNTSRLLQVLHQHNSSSKQSQLKIEDLGTQFMQTRKNLYLVESDSSFPVPEGSDLSKHANLCIENALSLLAEHKSVYRAERDEAIPSRRSSWILKLSGQSAKRRHGVSETALLVKSLALLDPALRDFIRQFRLGEPYEADPPEIRRQRNTISLYMQQFHDSKTTISSRRPPVSLDHMPSSVTSPNSPTKTDQGPWESQRILCLEDTGLRGMTSLYVLGLLMMEIANIEEQHEEYPCDSSTSSPLYTLRTQGDKHLMRISNNRDPRLYRFRPCHYFDYISGTGIGGMSAIMLGAMRFSVPEVLDRNQNVFSAVPPSLSIDPSSDVLAGLSHGLTKLSATAYRLKRSKSRSKSRQESLLKALQANLEQEYTASIAEKDRALTSKDSPQHVWLEADKGTCQTICITALKASKGVHRPYVLRSYSPDPRKVGTWLKNADQHTYQMSIVDACLVTIAPPVFHDRVKIKGFSGTFKDASILDVNLNPAWEAYQEVTALYDAPAVEQLVSINCINRKFNASYPSKVRSRENKELEATLEAAYFPFDILDHLSINPTADEDRETPDALAREAERRAKIFCRKHEDDLVRCATSLVEARRRRARTVEWSTFAGLRMPAKSSSGSHTVQSGWKTRDSSEERQATAETV